MTKSPGTPDDVATRRLVTEMFLKNVGAVLVKRVAQILRDGGIPLMPLKGALLQQLVYPPNAYRPIADVDILVPEARFADACAALRHAGFTRETWEIGGWQATFRDPSGPPLGVDLHRRLTRTSRSRLTASGMFERGRPDEDLFGAPVIVPCPPDLLAHLLLHMTLHWLNLGTLHRPGDLEALASALTLDPDGCAHHLDEQGLLPHASLMLPLIARAAPGPFVPALARRLPLPRRARVASWIVGTLAARYPRPGHPARRLAGLALAPSVSGAITSAIRDRVVSGAPRALA